MNKNCHNPRTSNYIDIKLGSLTKLDKRDTAVSEIFDDNVVSGNYDPPVIFRVYGRFGAIQKPASRQVVDNFLNVH